jgi:hypothetical protein
MGPEALKMKLSYFPFPMSHWAKYMKVVDQCVKVSFTNALRRAEIKDFHFHDLRHTFASHMIMRGASLKEVQEILGHATMTMTMRYAHLSQERKKKAINLLNGLTSNNTQTLGNYMSQNVTNGV